MVWRPRTTNPHGKWYHNTTHVSHPVPVSTEGWATPSPPTRYRRPERWARYWLEPVDASCTLPSHFLLCPIYLMKNHSQKHCCSGVWQQIPSRFIYKARFPTRKSKEFQKRPLKIPSFSEEMNDFQTCSVRKQLEVGSRGKDIESLIGRAKRIEIGVGKMMMERRRRKHISIL